MKNKTIGALMAASLTASAAIAEDDKFLWLEDVQGKKALEWVAEKNKHSLGILENDSRFKGLMERSLKDYNATDKIAYSGLYGGAVHNFWQDSDHVRGIWRRTSMKSYATDDTKWVDILDFDQLAKDEGENWVYKGRDCLAPDFGRCLVRLSRGGGDAVVVREFDAVTKRFVDGGFSTPEAKQNVAWVDADHIMIATDFGEGTMNTSGYARQVRLWKRGTPLSSAKMLINAPEDVTFNFPMTSHRPDGTYTGVIQGPDFFTQVIHIMEGTLEEPELTELDLPKGIDFQGFFADMMLILMRKDWAVGGKTVKAGSLVSIKVEDAMRGRPEMSLTTVYAPAASGAIEGVNIGKNRVFVSVLDDVTGQLMEAMPSNTGWNTKNLGMPANGSLNVISADEWSDNAYVNFESYLQPDTLYTISRGGKPEETKSLPARFDAKDLVTEQKFATSADGTKVPYFLVRHKNTKLDNTTPTILYGYGGFEIALTPGYLSGVGKLWLQEGGAYVVANIRGGGEYGPAWHQAALKENRQRAYDDFIAVAEDLISSGVTSPQHLGIRGGSNGGLLMGVMTTQRPDLFNAVICAVPLLDMMRYHTLLAGASWMGEYGNPDIAEERDFIAKYSPYQNLKADETYPEVFFYTSTKDDRVHPGHARKMAAKMLDMGKPVLYYENTEGGHSAAANLKQRAYTDALQVVYALKKLSDK
ncbi:prolyl oligopeptidase family serine peptidase [Kordiimonas laminariae]|uniref:prolyl oligopeptidase family serine peptidase n=1 Tax=Kordiimonas laminariae TaxID=2917717 RepID=UPI001FF6E593|nr:prolyl oligopeptidase family serine peptidase [Kordiimonas laminariae]MCK0069057.1 prolyl oligopeptidase family serine peptidase [Kordiimonas laminariae]